MAEDCSTLSLKWKKGNESTFNNVNYKKGHNYYVKIKSWYVLLKNDKESSIMFIWQAKQDNIESKLYYYLDLISFEISTVYQ